MNKAMFKIQIAAKTCNISMLYRGMWALRPPGWVVFNVKKRQLWYSKWAELQWLATCVCQQEPRGPSGVCLYYKCALHRGTNATDKKGAKKLIPHWPLTCGTKGLPCVHTEEVQTHFMIPLCVLLLITSPPSYGHLEPPFSRRQTRHHSFTRLLGAFVRWLLAEKGKQINTSPMGLTGNLYLGWNMSTGRPDSLTVTGQLTSCTEALFPCY